MPKFNVGDTVRPRQSKMTFQVAVVDPDGREGVILTTHPIYREFLTDNLDLVTNE